MAREESPWTADGGGAAVGEAAPWSTDGGAAAVGEAAPWSTNGGAATIGEAAPWSTNGGAAGVADAATARLTARLGAAPCSGDIPEKDPAKAPGAVANGLCGSFRSALSRSTLQGSFRRLIARDAGTARPSL